VVNSASQSLAEFKSQRLGGLLSGTSSTVTAPPIVGTSIADTASDRMARTAPKKSSTAFMDGIRKSGQRQHASFMQGLAAKQSAITGVSGAQGAPGAAGGRYSANIPGMKAPKGASGQMGPNGYGGRYGLTVPASQSFTALENAYAKQFGQGLGVNDGYRSYAKQVEAKQKYGSKAADPGHSVHGWGQALDFGGPIQNQNSAQHAWLRQNAAQFGWYWVGQRYGEPWHWEYRPNG